MKPVAGQDSLRGGWNLLRFRVMDDAVPVTAEQPTADGRAGFVRIPGRSAFTHVEEGPVAGTSTRSVSPIPARVLSSPIPEAFLQSVTGWKREFECCT